MIKLANRFFEKMFMADKWNVGYINQSLTDLIEQKKLNKIEWLKEDNVDYAADPFITDIDNKIKIYYEELNFWHGRGKIMVIEDFDFNTKREVRGIDPSTIHLSYPYLIHKDNQLYCIPETSRAKEVVLYKVNTSKPNVLSRYKILLSGKDFVDSSVIFYANKYWLFTSVAGHDDELYIYYSSTLEGDYQPHRQNPIKVEKSTCRSAGSLFVVNDSIYRPTQNPTHCYGGSIQINKILILTEDTYQTETVFEILPDKDYSRGIHHISFSQDKIVVDGKRRVRELLMPLKKLVKVVRN